MSEADETRREREMRLRSMLQMRAPQSAIENECRLVLASYRGGHVRAILWQIKVLLKDRCEWYLSLVQCAVQRAIHHTAERFGIHLKYAYGEKECWICDIREFHAKMDRMRRESDCQRLAKETADVN